MSFDSNCLAALKKGEQLSYDPAGSRFFATPAEDPESVKTAARALKTALFSDNQKGVASKGDLYSCAEIFLDREITLHRGELEQGLSSCKRDSFLMDLEAIDRLLVAKHLQEKGKVDALSPEVIQSHYKTQAARDQLDKWLNEPTHRAMKEKTRVEVRKLPPKHPEYMNEKVIDRVEGARAFALHPAQVKFIKENRLEKQVGTREGDQIYVDPQTKDLGVKSQKKIAPVPVLEKELISERNRLYMPHGDTRTRVFYNDQVGLTECVKGDPLKEDPEYFSTLPVFKTKAHRNHRDFRLEIWTISSSDDEHDYNHSWIKLKNPQGEVRSAGLFRREGEEKPYFSLLETSAGDFHAGDRYEFMRLEPYMQRTVVTVTEEQHAQAIRLIEQIQNDAAHRNFNVVNQNCTSVVDRVLREVLHYDLPLRGSLLDTFCGIDIANNFFVKYIPPIRLLAFFSCYILCILRNLFWLAIGATFWGDEDKRVFSSFWQLFSSEAGRPHLPILARRWQEKVEKRRAEKIQEIEARYVSRKDEESIKLKQSEIHTVKTSIPEELQRRPERSFWWYLGDLFWSLSDDDSVIPAP